MTHSSEWNNINSMYEHSKSVLYKRKQWTIYIIDYVLDLIFFLNYCFRDWKKNRLEKVWMMTWKTLWKGVFFYIWKEDFLLGNIYQSTLNWFTLIIWSKIFIFYHFFTQQIIFLQNNSLNSFHLQSRKSPMDMFWSQNCHDQSKTDHESPNNR